MSLTPRLTLIGLYNFNNSLFSNLMLPDEMDNETFIDSLLMKYGECPLIYPDLDYMLLAIGAWSRKWYDNIDRMCKAIEADYNPIHNYDRHEEWNGTDEYTLNSKIKDDGSIETKNNGTEENKVSAYNEDEYQPDNETLTDSTTTTETENNSNRDETKSGEDSKTGHLYGNIGVTTSQQMLTDEIELRRKYNIYDIVSELFYKEFCIYIF